MRKDILYAWEKLQRETGPVLASEARRRGIPPGCLAQDIARGDLIRVLPGVYRRKEERWDKDARLKIVEQALHSAVVTMGTALALEGVDGDSLDQTIWLSFPRDTHVPDLDPLGAKAVQSAHDLHSFGAGRSLDSDRRLTAHSPARAVVECLRRRSLIGHEATASALNAALAFELTTPEEILEVADRCRAGTIARSYLATWSRRELVSDEDVDDPVPESLTARRGRPPIRRERLPLALEISLRKGTLDPDLARRYDVAEAKRRLRAQGVPIPHARKSRSD